MKRENPFEPSTPYKRAYNDISRDLNHSIYAFVGFTIIGIAGFYLLSHCSNQNNQNKLEVIIKQ